MSSIQASDTGSSGKGILAGKRLDVLLLFLLLMARVRIDTLADLVLPTRHEDLRTLAWVRAIFSAETLDLLSDWLTDPISLIFISIAFAACLLYLLIDLLSRQPHGQPVYLLKLTIVFVIIGATIFVSTAKLISLRNAFGPASYCHDGGVIQTEEAVKLFLAGKNPYSENYLDTPLAEWGVDYRSAVYHYPYLPWSFAFSAPVYLAFVSLTGWFDQRIIYLFLFALILIMALRLTSNRTARLSLVMILGLNPIMGSDIIFGQNDVFVLFWIVLALWLLPRRPGAEAPEWRYYASTLAMGLAVASKPTAWFVLPFFLLYLVSLDFRKTGEQSSHSFRWARRLIPLPVVFLLLIVPYLIWDAPALLDDVWKWSSGASEIPYQIRGWGAAIWVLALGLVGSRLDYFAFWIPQALVCVPLILLQLRQQWRGLLGQRTTAGIAPIAFHAGILLFAYAFFSRFLNENYIGFIAALLAIGTLGDWPASHTEETQQTGGATPVA